jgi:hypothetical protein
MQGRVFPDVSFVFRRAYQCFRHRRDYDDLSSEAHQESEYSGSDVSEYAMLRLEKTWRRHAQPGESGRGLLKKGPSSG